MKKFLIVFLAIFLIGGLIYFSQSHNSKESSASTEIFPGDTRIYKEKKLPRWLLFIEKKNAF